MNVDVGSSPALSGLPRASLFLPLIAIFSALALPQRLCVSNELFALALSTSCVCGACSADRRFGDLGSGLAIPKMLIYNLKTRLGLAQDWTGIHESTANTALQFHAGDMPHKERSMLRQQTGAPADMFYCYFLEHHHNTDFYQSYQSYQSCTFNPL